MSKEPKDNDLRQVSGAKYSQPGITSGLSSLAVSCHLGVQGIQGTGQGLGSGLGGVGSADPQAADGLEMRENPQVSPVPTYF